MTRRQLSPTDSQPLCEQLIAAWDRGDSDTAIWQLVIENEWYLSRLESAALSICRHRRALHLVDDVKQEAMLMLGARLSGIKAAANREMFSDHFAGWFGTIVVNHCREAVRKLARNAALWIDTPIDEMGLSCRETNRLNTGLTEAIECAPPSERDVLRLARNGHELKGIAVTLNQSYWKTRRLLISGAATLAKVLTIWLLAATAQAVDLPESCRIHNRGGRCVLSNLATLGYRHRIAALESLAPNGRVEGQEGPLDHEVRKLLNSLGIVWTGRDHGNFDRTLLPLANSRGVIVSMKRGAPWLWGRTLQCNHSIILTSYDADGVSFYCPNNPQQIWRAGREWFTFWWMGNSMVFDTHEEN